MPWMKTWLLLCSWLAAPTVCISHELRLRSASGGASLEASDCKVKVSEAGDHSMALSDGQTWTGLNTGVMITSKYAGEWTPKVHQHNITAVDIDALVDDKVQVVAVGRGVVGDGVAQLHSSALTRLDELRKKNVDVFVGNTYEAKDYFNKACESSGSKKVSALFHTGCF
mmetsp:Transcript_68105/g.127184  ORF Transcript_68105/g.127184 Transcript_68105/m.127184 type:complete len:169 (-) Transcript_68105:116-622(-)